MRFIDVDNFINRERDMWVIIMFFHVTPLRYMYPDNESVAIYTIRVSATCIPTRKGGGK